MTQKRAISLRFELAILRDATLAARMLIDVARHKRAEDDADERRLGDAAAAVLELVQARARLLDLAFGRALDPEVVVERFNEVRVSAAAFQQLQAEDLLLTVPPRLSQERRK